jgi:hypothetical protein
MEDSMFFPSVPRGHSEVPVWEPLDSEVETHAVDSLDSADLGQMMADLLDGASGVASYSPEWLNWGHGGVPEQSRTMSQ